MVRGDPEEVTGSVPNFSELTKIANEIIKNLVYYINANQGGLFILNEQEGSVKIYDLLAAFAFDRKKFIKTKY